MCVLILDHGVSMKIMYVSKLENIDIQIKFFEKTPFPQRLQEIIETNEKAIKKLDELIEVIDKLRKLDVPVHTRVYGIDVGYISVELEPRTDKAEIAITIPKEKEKLLERYRRIDGKELDTKTLRELRDIAKKEKEFAEKLLADLINYGLVVALKKEEDEE